MPGNREVVLVTGVSGFIGKHLAREFLEHGYDVRGTVRSAEKGEAVRAALSGFADGGNFDVVVADLLADAGWAEAVAGVDHVVHSASPFPMAQPKNPDVLVRPAVDGTLRVLRAAAEGGARTFVQTSSVAAITPGNTRRDAPLTEDDWADLDSTSATPYAKSKALAERAARDFIEKEQPALRYASVNPAFVLGPLLDRSDGTSAALVEMMLKGRYPAVPRIQFAVVDVRDVAAAHRLTIERGRANGRYIAASDSIWIREMSAILRNDLGEKARKVPHRQLPDFVVRVAALFDRSLASIVPELGRQMRIDASRTRAELGIEFRSTEEAVRSMGESLIRLGVV